MSQDNSKTEGSNLADDHLPPMITWPQWSLLLWPQGRFEYHPIRLRSPSPELAEHLRCYLMVQLTLGDTRERCYFTVAAYGVLSGLPHIEGTVQDEGWFSLWPDYDEQQVTPNDVQTHKEQFDKQLRQLVDYLNGQLLPTAWRCDWVDVLMRESHEDDGKGVYEHVTRRRGYTFPHRSAAEAGFAKDEEFIIG